MLSIFNFKSRFTHLFLNQIRKKSQSARPDDLKTKIGLEIHARILSKTKMFSDADSFDLTNTPVNKNVSFFDAALPGTMPVLNSRGIEAAVLTALALNCQINVMSIFERKHYFYSDLPAGYQITQQRFPLASNGSLKYPVVDPRTHKLSYKQCRIKQIQLEHDSARSIQVDEIFSKLNKESQLPQKSLLIDLNRAGTGLIEIVTEPDFESAFDCYSFARELAALLKSIGTCKSQVGEGGFRVDVNVSVHQIDKMSNPNKILPGVRVELKNLSSFNAILKGTEYEIKRQQELIRKKEKIYFETRTYDSASGKTISLRSKEDQFDYRFMPEPNLLPLVVYSPSFKPDVNTLKCETNKELHLSQVFVQDLNYLKSKKSFFYSDFDKIKDEYRQKQLPDQRRMFLVKQYGITPENAFIFVANNLDFIIKNLLPEENVSNEDVRLYVRVLLTEYLNQVNENPDLEKIGFELKCAKIRSFVEIIKEGKISRRIWLPFFKKLFDYRNLQKLAIDLAEEENLFIIKDEKLIEESIIKVFEQNSKATAQYKINEKKRDKIFDFFVGRVHQELRNVADPDLVNNLILKNLKQLVKQQ